MDLLIPHGALVQGPSEIWAMEAQLQRPEQVEIEAARFISVDTGSLLNCLSIFWFICLSISFYFDFSSHEKP